ncbi:30S ribosomal protein S2 [Hugenholtzia roseola]|uniref:30S ribosomal protein S2 n=1 Tax=Hugenholtzia roseola TaxID=1002 RepID=UPI00040D37BC|nr:30S ribosomal protein S2 [Hugenholtzia roseola]
MSVKVEYKDLLDAGVHFGHLKRKWNPRMAPYIFMERNGIHIIDLNKTLASLERAAAAVKDMSRKGKKILFVATKKQAQEVVKQRAEELGMPYVTERWLGGMLTNFNTVKKSIKKMQSTERLMKSDNYKNLAKRERLMISREQEKLERVLGGIANINRTPAALFIVDISREHIAVKEAKRLGIPVIAMVDTNSDPESVDFAIPANDDAFKSISLITEVIAQAIKEGEQERKEEKAEAQRREEEEKKRAIDEKPAATKETAADEE